MMKKIFAFTLALLPLAAACGGSSTSSPAPTSPPTAGAPAPADDPSCPVAVPGTSVNVEDTDTGAALVFVTTGDVAELRARVGKMAQMHNEQHEKMGAMPTGTEAGGHDHAAMGHDHGAMGHEDAAMGHDHAAMGHEHMNHAGGMVSVHSSAQVEEIEGGARLVYTTAPDDVNALREELRMHAQHMAAGSCAMGEHG